MTAKGYTTTWGAVTAMLVVVFAGAVISSPRVRAHENGANNHPDGSDPRIARGFKIAPVHLNLEGKDQNLVGLGSYLVNAVGACGDCHSVSEYAQNRNPYFGQKKKIDPTDYLGGGVDFGALVPGSPDIVSRNLTPDKTGLPEGGHTFDEFRQIIRTGVDLDHLHPSCSPSVNTNCLPPPFDGEVLQIMPWPIYQSWTDQDLRAIYEYLSAIPCFAGPPAPSPLHNDCN
jgi:cytochrome c553